MSKWAILWLTLVAAPLARAERLSFAKPHSGIILGAGYYADPFLQANVNPVPNLAPTGTSAAGTAVTRLPIKVGFFVEPLRTLSFELYGRYVTSLHNTWTCTGTLAGTGSSTWSSLGVGFGAAASLWTSDRLRLQLAGQIEHVGEKAQVSTTATGASETLNVSASSTLFSVGLRPEITLVDMWILSLFAGYQYSAAVNWTAATAGTFFGVAQSGNLQNPANGANVTFQNNGLLLEAAFKLIFY